MPHVQLGNTWVELKSAKGFTSKSTARSKFGTGSPSKSGLASVLASAGFAGDALSPELEGATLPLSDDCLSKAVLTSVALEIMSLILFKPAGWLLAYLFLTRSGILGEASSFAWLFLEEFERTKYKQHRRVKNCSLQCSEILHL